MIAHTIRSAALATSVTEHAIQLAIRERRLKVRDLDGKLLILTADLQEWLASLPDADPQAA
ncbi:hypothetical protein QMG61_15210 [Cryobacterium sp. PH31-AA6]|uniref:hypothetical protein n=1 Tax=Cryobacterium sp. PH31-AA6 TaxID=3046205 RepID=UPI0024BA8114|nr:hypothetical protein [Cryobacterium sp. PH31-AA6]MDJ0325113.1 hypothetical protein [Cryobacterium sp. PH31-AA6]